MDCRVETVMDEINGQEQIQAWNSMQCQQDQHKLYKEGLLLEISLLPTRFNLISSSFVSCQIIQKHYKRKKNLAYILM